MNADNSFLIAAKYYESFHKGESLLHSPKQGFPKWKPLQLTYISAEFKIIINVPNFSDTERILEKGENDNYQLFLLFSTIFSKSFLFRTIEPHNCSDQILR